MAYSGVQGLKTVFPTAKPLQRSPAATNGKRMSMRAEGRTRTRRAAKKKAPVSIAKTISYAKRLPPKRPKLTAEEKAVVGLAGLSGRRAIKRVGIKALRALKSPVAKSSARTQLKLALGAKSGAVRAAAGGALGAVALAGLASFYLTRALLKRRAKTKEDRAENAFQLAQAYRLMRVAAEEKQGFPLTATQLRQASDAFQAELLKLGLTTADLSKL